MNKIRFERVLKEMEQAGIEQMLLTNPHSIHYLAGHYEEPWERFWALFISSSKEHCLVSNRLFTLDEVNGIDILWYEDGQDACRLLCSRIDKNKPLGVDDGLKAVSLLRLMELNAAKSYRLSSFCVDKVRARKDEEELERMRTVSHINDLAMAKFKELIHARVTEKQVANQMLDIYRELGADDYSFTPLVGFGANAAAGHHEPDDTVLKEGDCVLFDVGCIKDGYCSDMTRTFFYGHVDEESRKIYETVLKAQLAAEKAIKAGMVLKEIDQTARKIITDEGYGACFTHRLGHFIGREVHEKGDVSPVSEILAQPGMTFSVEPGIYVPGKVGVRIEDLVIVTEEGAEIMNHYPKELQIIPVS
ncbi:MAG: aminopeptidase P family protein [Lachnospiraceae bacterium]|nr:aminopeptidase P family protein [Lachnospiraceae bacterium]